MRQQTPSLPGKSCTKILGDILLISLGLLFVLILVEFADQPFRAANTLHELRLSLSNEDVDEGLNLIKRLHEMGDSKIDALRALLDQEQYLLTRIKDRHIEDDREETQVAEIANFQKKMEHYQQVFRDSRDAFKGLTDEATTLSALHKHSLQDLQKGKELKGKTESLAVRFNQFLIEMEEVIKLNSKWSQSVQNKMNSLEPQAEEHKSDKGQFKDVTSLPQYNSMPQLAQEILKPLQMDFLKELYSDKAKLHEQSELQKREKFYKEREYLADHFPEFQSSGSVSLTRYNLQSGVERRPWKEDILGDYPRLNKKFKLDEVASETGFCIIVPTYNNGNSFRTELNLNSIFSQNYTNYKVVMIDDASTDNTPAIIKKYLNFYDIPEKKCELVVNTQNKKALENIYMAIMNRCDGYEVAAIVDGDDELIGFNVLKVFNAVYAAQKLGVVYSNFYFYRHNLFDIKVGFNSQYLDSEKMHTRETYQKFSHLITFKVELLKEVKVADLQYTNGRFYHVAYDYAMMYPIMELSCGHIKYIDEFQYLYSTGTGLNDYEVLGQDQKALGEAILKKTPYECSRKYKD